MKKLMIIMIVALSTASFAQDDEGWSGNGALGFVSQSGNADTQTLSIGADAVNNLEKWRYSLGLKILQSESGDEDTADRFELYGQVDYKIDEKAYWLGSLRYEDDEFSQFESQLTATVGYGRVLVDSESNKLKGEIGLGVRRAEERISGDSDTEAIVRGVLGYTRVFSETASLSNDFLVESGSDNTFLKNVTALNAEISGDFGLQVAYEIRHNTDVADGIDKTDRVSSINLVYAID